MERARGDDTQDWLLPAGSAPPLMVELEHRVDEALAIAKASEAAVMSVGAAAIDAAEQARRAAELAERAAHSAEVASAAAGPVAAGDPPPPAVARASSGMGPPTAPPPAAAATSALDALESFNDHADRVLARLRDLERPAEPVAS
jgi:hypothetical protein